MLTDSQIAEVLEDAKTIAVVGLSGNPLRPSFGVAEYLQERGYRILPVNPNEPEVLGEKSYASLLEIAGPIDIVDIFRRPENVPEIVLQSIQKGVRCVWMQEGVVNESAAAQAEAAGIGVVMDRCILKEHRRLRRARLHS